MTWMSTLGRREWRFRRATWPRSEPTLARIHRHPTMSGVPCDIMAQEVIITLSDDLDGSAADETITFALDGAAYEIDLNAMMPLPSGRDVPKWDVPAAGQGAVSAVAMGTSAGRTEVGSAPPPLGCPRGRRVRSEAGVAAARQQDRASDGCPLHLSRRLPGPGRPVRDEDGLGCAS